MDAEEEKVGNGSGAAQGGNTWDFEEGKFESAQRVVLFCAFLLFCLLGRYKNQHIMCHFANIIISRIFPITFPSRPPSVVLPRRGQQRRPRAPSHEHRYCWECSSWNVVPARSRQLRGGRPGGLGPGGSVQSPVAGPGRPGVELRLGYGSSEQQHRQCKCKLFQYRDGIAFGRVGVVPLSPESNHRLSDGK